MMGARGRFSALVFLLPAVWSIDAPAQELRTSDFRLPETFYQRLDLSFNGGISRDREESPGEFSEARSSDQGSAAMFYSFYRADESTIMDFRPALSVSFGASENEQRDSLVIQEVTSQRSFIRISLPFEGSWYLEPEHWYVYSSALAEAQSSSESGKYSLSAQLPNYIESKTYGYDVTAGAGVGFGKVRNGQSIFAILRILDRFREDSLLTREASREEIIALAQMYSRRSKYLALFDYPEKYFFGDVIGALDSLGIVNEASLDARAILNVADVRLESMFPRLFGWRIQAGLEHSSFQWTWGESGNQRFERGSIDYFLVAAEYGYDLSLATHFFTSVRRKLSITPRIEKRAVIDASFSVLHELTDRIESSLGYSYRWENEHDLPRPTPNTSHLLHGGFRFYLENRVVLTLNAQYGETRNEPGWRSRERSSFGVSFGLVYRFF